MSIDRAIDRVYGSAGKFTAADDRGADDGGVTGFMAVLFSGTACGLRAVDVCAGPLRETSVRRSPGHPANNSTATAKRGIVRIMSRTGGPSRAQ